MSNGMSANARASELRNLIAACASRMRALQTDLRNPARLEDEIARREARIALDQAYVADARETLERGRDRVIELDERVTELRRELALVENENKVERLLELARRVAHES
jgi:hypothetical protein